MLGADLLNGDDGRDRVTYAARTAPLNVSLGSFWGDGESGEWDYVSSSVEEVVGGSGDDRITGTSAANTFIGGPGNDTLDGRDGNDVLEGGDGTDKLDAGNGDDILRSRDAAADTVNCGAGTDSIDVDAGDTVAADCERPADRSGWHGCRPARPRSIACPARCGSRARATCASRSPARSPR